MKNDAPMSINKCIKALLLLFAFSACSNGVSEKGDLLASLEQGEMIDLAENEIIVGAAQFEKYLGLLKGKKVALVANQTTVVNDTHLVDLLLLKGIEVVKVFAPEHGFRGTADAGEHVASGVDTKTGLPLISLYGSNKKPSADQLEDVDVLVFDIQDVGARFYTYLSTLHYILEAAGEQQKKVVVLDRPNPNIQWVDGPILEEKHKSFVGIHTIPVLHGMTLGELSNMMVNEGWLKGKVKPNFKVIPCENYSRAKRYHIPIAPSPNLPNNVSIYLYPSLCLFEGTTVGVGRGTDFPFQAWGSPVYKGKMTFEFTPQPNVGAKHPRFKGKVCYGEDLRTFPKEKVNGFDLTWLMKAYENHPKKERFFKSFFTLLAGTEKLQKQIEKGMTAEAIRETWQKELEDFKTQRKPYLLYHE